MNEYSFLINK